MCARVNTHITSSHHDPIRLEQNGIKIVDTFFRFNLANDEGTQRFFLCWIHGQGCNATLEVGHDGSDIVGCPNERSGDVIGTDLDGPFQILLIFVGESG